MNGLPVAMREIYLYTLNTFRFIFYSVLVIVLAGCSDHVAPIVPVNPDNSIDQTIYSDVPIEFGCGEMTKAPINNMKDLESTTNYGLFSVKQGTEDLANQNSLIDFKNELLTYNKAYGFNVKGAYYPNTDDKYSFYSYYTYQNDSLIRAGVSTDDSFKTTQTKTSVAMYAYQPPNGLKQRLLGYQHDVLLAKAKGVDPKTGAEIDAFNASVVKAGAKPVFNFTHPMSLVSFSVTLAQNLTSDLGANMLRVDQVSLMNSPCYAELCIIDLEPDPTKNMEGKFENIQYSDQEGKVPFLRGADNSRSLRCELLTPDRGVTKPLGAQTMVIVPQVEPLICRMQISSHKYDSAKGTFIHSGNWKYDIELDPLDYVDEASEFYNTMLAEGRYLPGCSYEFNIIVDLVPSGKQSIPKVKGTLVK